MRPEAAVIFWGSGLSYFLCPLGRESGRNAVCGGGQQGLGRLWVGTGQITGTWSCRGRKARAAGHAGAACLGAARDSKGAEGSCRRLRTADSWGPAASHRKTTKRNYGEQPGESRGSHHIVEGDAKYLKSAQNWAIWDHLNESEGLVTTTESLKRAGPARPAVPEAGVNSLFGVRVE